MQKRKTYIAFVILGLFCSLTACDTCDSSGSGGDGNADNIIYVTAFPLNGLTPTVFTVDMDDYTTTPLISNATIYSPPSADGKIAFLRYDAADNSNSIWLMRTDRSDSILVFTDNSDYSAAYPVLSPNGNKIAFYGGDNLLLLWTQGSGWIERLSHKAIAGTLATFSPDGQKLAFLESDKSYGTVSLKIVSVDNTDLVLKKISFDSATVRSGAEISPQWDNSSNMVAVTLTIKGVDCVYILNDQKADTLAIPELGIRSASLSPNGNMLCFTASNGSLWIRDLTSNTPAYYKVAEYDQSEFNLYADWNYSGSRLIYGKFYSDVAGASQSNLFAVDISKADGIKAVNRTIVTTNVYKGFWGKRK